MTGFPIGLTSVLTGATRSQLIGWRKRNLIVPEVRAERPPLWSLRDIVALRSVAFLRSHISLQQVSKAFQTLDILDMQDHPSEYRFGTDGRTIYVQDPYGNGAIDLNRQVGNNTIFTFEDMVDTFANFNDQPVAPLYQPAKHIVLDFKRMGGWPTIEYTRVPYDTVANLVDGEAVTVDDVANFYPGISAAAAQSAIDFSNGIEAA